MDRKILVNYLFNILYQIARNVLSILIVPYTMGHLGESVLGISDFANNISAWFILFGVLGVNVYGNREIAKVRDNKDDLSRTFFEILTMQITNVLIAAIAYVVFVRFTVTSNIYVYYLTLISILASCFDICWFFFGVENFKVISIRNMVIKFAGVALIMLLVKKPEDLWIYVIINTVGDLLGNLAMFISLKNYIHKVPFSFKEAYKKHFWATFELFVPTIANSVYTLLDQTMLGYLIEDKGAVALYKTSQGFVRLFLYFVTSIGHAMLPRIANIYHKDPKSPEVSTFINATFQLALFLSVPMMCGMMFVSPYFMPWYLPGQPSIILLVQVSSPIIICLALSNVFGTQYLIPTGHNKEYTTSVIVGAVTNTIVNVLLIPKFAGVGAAIGSVVAEIAVTGTQYMYVHKNLKLQNLSYILRYVIGSAVMSLVVILIGNTFGNRFLVNVMQAGFGLVTYLIVLLVLRDPTVLKVISKAKEMIHRG